MHVGGTHRVARLGEPTRHLHRLQAQPAPPPPAATLPAIPLSKANGPWKVDPYQAQHDANIALESIDWSKRDIVIWVPGTDNHTIHPKFEQAVREAWGADASLSRIDYPATWDMYRSVPTGLATLRIVLQAIAAHGGDHRVFLAGESQGAWLIGEALADPAVGKVVTRAQLFGHPWVAAHDYADGHDARVREVNHVGDQVSEPIKGDVTGAMQAMMAVHQLSPAGAGKLAGALVENPKHALLMGEWLLRSLPGAKTFLKDPHDYGPDMTFGVEWLRWGKDGDPNAGDGPAAAA